MTRKQFFLVFMIPTFIILFFLAFYPLLNAFYYSLQNWDLRSSRPIRFVGLKNYIQLFTDARFLNSLRISLLWSVLLLDFRFFGAGLLAPLINDNAKGVLEPFVYLFLLYRTPSRVGAAYMWRLMYSSSIGIINYFLSFLRIGPIGFLENPSMLFTQ